MYRSVTGSISTPTNCFTSGNICSESEFLTLSFVFERLAAFVRRAVAAVADLWRFVEAVGPTRHRLQAAAPTCRLRTRPSHQVLHPHHHLPGHCQNFILIRHKQKIQRWSNRLLLTIWHSTGRHRVAVLWRHQTWIEHHFKSRRRAWVKQTPSVWLKCCFKHRSTAPVKLSPAYLCSNMEANRELNVCK